MAWYCQVGVVEPLRPVLHFPSAEACCEEKDGIELLDRRLPVGPKEIGEGVQYGIDDVQYGQRAPKRLK